jgi:hypothetical protein
MIKFQQKLFKQEMKHKIINFIWNMEKMPDNGKEYIIVSVYLKGKKTGHSNYQEMPLLSTSYEKL